jgi:ubiquinol-cytochrome c reductase cytochrome c1 subunit
MRVTHAFAGALAALCLMGLGAGAALAAGEAKHPREVEWEHDGPFGMFDRGALQRGFQVYKEVCAVCHGMEHLRYRNLGEPGGPFQAVAPRDWDEKGIKPVLGVPGHGKEIIDANENPWVRAIADDYKIADLDRTSGDMVERDGRPADRLKPPFENAFKAAAALGASPPDLSVITKARANGENYLYSLLTGYVDPPAGKEPPGGATNLHYNPYFAGGWIAMARPLNEDQVTYADGTKATVDQMARDVTTFLAWAGDPKAEERKSLGLQVIAYLLLLTLLLYMAYKQVWRNEKH